MKQKRKLYKTKPKTPKHLALGAFHRVKPLVLSEVGLPIVVGLILIASFLFLPPASAQNIPDGPKLRLGNLLSSVAETLHMPRTVPEPAPAPTDQENAQPGLASPTGKTKAGKKSSSSPQTYSIAPGNHFVTLPPGSALPSDSTCAAQVKAANETRPANSTYNQTRGVGGNTEFPRVTGDFVGTTDEILQWASCKWGIDEDIARAQAVKESWWFHRTGGDFTTDPALCWPPNNQLVNGQCPESVGILQVRYEYHKSGLAAGTYSPYYSTAYNADYTYAVWRDCYEGNMTWLNTVEKGAVYAAGDVWGCVGEWFSGRWYTAPTYNYINAIKGYLNNRMWENPDFLSAT